MKVSVVGLGHVGLVTAACLAHVGHQVVGVDEDERVVGFVARGESPFFEPDLPHLIRQGLQTGRLTIGRTISEAMDSSEVALICVGTPIRESGEANLTSVERVARGLLGHLRGYSVLTEKSTVPVGTGDWIRRTAEWLAPSAEFDVASNPEFLREGQAVADTLSPSRVVVGAPTPRAHGVLRNLYEPIIARSGCPYVATDVATAELIKLAANAFLATKISFINAVADVCEAADADVEVVASTIGLDPRIGPQFLQAGIGYGGFCLPKDVAAFRHRAAELGIDLRLLSEVSLVNDSRTDAILRKMRRILWNLEGKRICVWGLSFKAGTDDLRDSPALRVIHRLVAEGCDVAAYDPVALRAATGLVGDAELVDEPYEAARGANALVICTDWDDFREVDLRALAAVMAEPVVVDGRNLLDPETVAAAGFIYAGVGRPVRYPARLPTGVDVQVAARVGEGIPDPTMASTDAAGGALMRRAVVTGGAGFLGSHLCEELLTQGWQVLAVDNLLTGSVDNVQHLVGLDDFHFLEWDACMPIDVRGPVDAVLHFASPASPKDYLAHPIETLKAGAMGTTATLDLAVKKRAQYLLASTSEVYGDPRVHPQPETYWGNVNPVGPRSVYDEAKRFAEALAMAYHRTFDLDVKIVRIFNTYGPRLSPGDGRAIPNFLEQALRGESLTVYGDGTQTRSFCYVDDEIRGILALLQSDWVGPMNIGNPDEWTMLDLASFVLRITGSDSSVAFEPLPVDDPVRRCPDISVARRVLGWQPTVALSEGLTRTADWIRAAPTVRGVV